LLLTNPRWNCARQVVDVQINVVGLDISNFSWERSTDEVIMQIDLSLEQPKLGGDRACKLVLEIEPVRQAGQLSDLGWKRSSHLVIIQPRISESCQRPNLGR
jgi:hypothetical protein